MPEKLVVRFRLGSRYPLRALVDINFNAVNQCSLPVLADGVDALAAQVEAMTGICRNDKTKS